MLDDTTRPKTITPPQVNVSICPESSGVSTAAASIPSVAKNNPFDRPAAMKRMWLDPVYRDHMVRVHRGKTQLPESIRKRVEKMKGRRHSPETIEKIRVSKIGKLNAMWGTKASPSTIEKKRRAMLGRTRSPEACAKCSASVRRVWANPEYRNRTVRSVLASVMARPTTPELRVQTILNTHFPGQWKYTGNGDVVIGGKNPDFVNVNGRKVVIEVFGDWWHGEKWTGRTCEQEETQRINHFAAYGFRCLILWEHEVAHEDAVVARLSAL